MIYGMGLCAGAGGLELGLRIALGDDYRCVVYVEREAYAAATLVARMADQALDQAPVWDDLSDFDGCGWRGVVDLVSAGFSCQPWSSAGKRLGIEDERWLWPDLHRVICEVGPEWVFLENVPGLVHGGIEHVLRDLAASGFAAEWDCVSAAEVGASQLRQRLYILAHSGVGQADASSRGLRADARSDARSRRQSDGRDSDVAGPTPQRPGETGRLRARSPLRPGRSGAPVAESDADGRQGVGRVVSDERDTPRGNHTDGRERPSVLLDDADDRRRGWQDNQIRPGRDRPGRAGPLGDADEQRHAGRARESERRPFRRDAPQGSGEQLGSPNCSGLSLAARERPERFAADAGYWPPDRRFRGEWPREFEPAVRRVADGMAPWVDRLRLTGNGVVPLAAAVAFLRLRARLTGL